MDNFSIFETCLGQPVHNYYFWNRINNYFCIFVVIEFMFCWDKSSLYKKMFKGCWSISVHDDTWSISVGFKGCSVMLLFIIYLLLATPFPFSFPYAGIRAGAYVLPECWFISVPANFRFLICPLFSKGHAEIYREIRHDLCYKVWHIECPVFDRTVFSPFFIVWELNLETKYIIGNKSLGTHIAS